MATLGSNRSTESFAQNGRLVSLSKLLQTVPNSPTHAPSSPMNQTNLSFHNFHLNVPVSKTSTKFYQKGYSSIKLKEIFHDMSTTTRNPSPTNKLSPFARTFSNTLPSGKANNTAIDFYHTSKSLKIPVFGKVKSSPSAQYNKMVTVSDFPLKTTGFDASYMNQLTDKHETQYSMLSSPKKLGMTDTFQSKRKMIDKDTLAAYRTIINSTDHGKLHETLPMPKEKPVFTSIRAKNDSKAKERRSKTIETEKDEALQRTVQEEAKFVDELKVRGIVDFHRKVTMNNFINGKYLVEPDAEGEFKEVRAQMRKLPINSKSEKEHKKEFWAHFSRHLSLEDNLVQSSVRKPEKKTKSRKTGRFFKVFESKLQMSTEGDSVPKSHERDFRKKEESSHQHVQHVEQMKGLRRMLSKDKIMSENEQLVFKLIKAGNESDLGYLLSQFNDLVRARDNRLETLLHWAAKRGNLSIVQCLCRYGADIDALDMANRRPVDIAERLKKDEIYEYLKRLHYKKEADHRLAGV